jgi:hypothetical protein
VAKAMVLRRTIIGKFAPNLTVCLSKISVLHYGALIPAARLKERSNFLMNDNEETDQQIKTLRDLLKSGVLNEHQHTVIERLIFATKTGTEESVAEYLATMDSAAVFWAANSESFIRLL